MTLIKAVMDRDRRYLLAKCLFKRYPIFKQWHFSQQFWAPGTRKSKGVVILIDKYIRFTHARTLADPEGKYLFVSGLI